MTTMMLEAKGSGGGKPPIVKTNLGYSDGSCPEQHEFGQPNKCVLGFGHNAILHQDANGREWF